MINSHLTYCTILWGCAKQSILDSLLKLQKRAVRIITLSKYRAHSDPLFFQIGILKIYEIYKLHVAAFIRTAKLGNISLNLKVFYMQFKFLEIRKNYDTRSSSRNLANPSFRTEIRKNCVLCSGPRIWNSLPADIKDCPSLYSFKRSIKKYFIS